MLQCACSLQELKLARLKQDNLDACRTEILRIQERVEVLIQQIKDVNVNETLKTAAINVVQVDTDDAARTHAQIEGANIQQRAGMKVLAEESAHTKRMNVDDLNREFS